MISKIAGFNVGIYTHNVFNKKKTKETYEIDMQKTRDIWCGKAHGYSKYFIEFVNIASVESIKLIK